MASGGYCKTLAQARLSLGSVHAMLGVLNKFLGLVSLADN
jgi:hypothetical protein